MKNQEHVSHNAVWYLKTQYVQYKSEVFVVIFLDSYNHFFFFFFFFHRLNAYEETNPFAPKAKSAEAKSEEVDALPGLKYYKPHRQGQADYTYKQGYQQPYKQDYESPYQQPYRQPYTQSYKQPYQQPYQKPYKQSYEQPYEQPYKQPYQQSSKQPYQHLYKQPPQYQQYEQQEYQGTPQQSQEVYANSQERNYHPDRFYKK